MSTSAHTNPGAGPGAVRIARDASFLAVASTLAAGTQAYAGVVYNDIGDVLIDHATVGLDVDQDGFADFFVQHDGDRLAVVSQVGNNAVVGSFTSPLSRGPDQGGTGKVSALAESTSVSPSDSFIGAGSMAYLKSGGTATPSYWTGDWIVPDGPAYLGLRFGIGGQDHYGWAGLTVDDATGAAMLLGFGYEDVSDTPIHIGAVPEPGTLAGLVVGAAALLAARRRKPVTDASG